MFEVVERLMEREQFAGHLDLELVEVDRDCAVLRMPYHEYLGIGRVNGGAIASLVDLAATCAFWAHPDADRDSRGATVNFTINFLRLAITDSLTATATVRRRGGTLCTGEVSVTNDIGDEFAVAVVTYKLQL